MTIPQKKLWDNQHGLFLLLTLGFIFALALGIGISHQIWLKPPAGGKGQGVEQVFDPGSASLVLKTRTEKFAFRKGRLSLDGPAVWQMPDEDRDPGKMPLAESQRFFAETGAKTPVNEKFEIDLVDFTNRPETHLHVRQVDHNELGFGGGFKIAFELLQVF